MASQYTYTQQVQSFTANTLLSFTTLVYFYKIQMYTENTDTRTNKDKVKERKRKTQRERDTELSVSLLTCRLSGCREECRLSLLSKQGRDVFLAAAVSSAGT